MVSGTLPIHSSFHTTEVDRSPPATAAALTMWAGSSGPPDGGTDSAHIVPTNSATAKVTHQPTRSDPINRRTYPLDVGVPMGAEATLPSPSR